MQENRKNKRSHNHKTVVLAATGSHRGKTTITSALLCKLKEQDCRVRAFKCGPDYIDPMFHQAVLGVPSRNLDTFFTDEVTTRRLFAHEMENYDLSIVEGVMGLYDGIGGVEVTGSTYDLARTLNAPVVLIVDGYGMGRSIIAEIKGFLSLDESHLIKGVVLNRVSKSFYQTIRPVIEEEAGVKLLGYFPDRKELRLESRYLGLKLPGENKQLMQMLELAAEQLKESAPELIDFCEGEGREVYDDVYLSKEAKGDYDEYLSGARIAIAQDEAFCFYYEDNLRILKEAGAKLVTFSPLHDAHLPEGIDGLILGGGYPELYARELEKNASMKAEIKAFYDAKKPIIAECGGFMYLHETLIDENGVKYRLVGALPATVRHTGHLVRFGYVTIEDKTTHRAIKGHEFHYYDSTLNGSDCVAKKPSTQKSWECMHLIEGSYLGFPHLYYPSNPEFVRDFLCYRGTLSL